MFRSCFDGGDTSFDTGKKVLPVIVDSAELDNRILFNCVVVERLTKAKLCSPLCAARPDRQEQHRQ